MFFDYRFWHYIGRPYDLAVNMQNATMRRFNSRLLMVVVAGLLLFALRNFWGMNTDGLTKVLANMTTTDYIIARYASLAGTILFSLLYLAFHIFGVAAILSAITKIPYPTLVPLQVLVTGILLLEKAVLFIVFAAKGSAVSLSFLSFGPLAATVMDNFYLVLFLNQLTVATALIIAMQYRFITAFVTEGRWRMNLLILIGLHVAMALLTAAVAYIPFDRLLNSVLGGGF